MGVLDSLKKAAEANPFKQAGDAMNQAVEKAKAAAPKKSPGELATEQAKARGDAALDAAKKRGETTVKTMDNNVLKKSF